MGRYLLLGLVLALAALTKTSSLALTVLTALVVIVRAVRRRSWAEFFTGGLATLLPVLLVAGWWYVRNLQLYGDLFGLNVFIEILGQRDVPADLAQLWRERYSFAAGYWGNFGGLNVPMPPWTYRILNTLAILAALGLLVLLLRTLFTAKDRSTATPSSVVGRPSSVIRRSCLLDIGHWTLDIVNCSLFLLLLWGLGVLVPWSRWAAITWSSQGRLIFTALPVWSLLLILGLSGWLPWRWGRWLVVTFALFLLALSVVAPWAWIAPAYAQAEPLTGGQVAAISHRVDAEFGTAERGAVVRLLGYDLRTEVVQPGGEVEMTLYWEALAPTDRDYTVFVHLLGEGELLVAQRDTFPGLGRLSTTWLEPGFRWADHTVVQVPATAYAPDLAPVEVGLYDVTTGARLPVTDPDGQPLDDNVRFGQVEIRPRPGDVPNPISVNFDDRMALIGYDLDRRVVRPGDAVTLTLHWRGLERMDVNYTVSTQLVDAGQRKAAQQDSWPLDGAAPTAAWEPEQALADVRTLRIFPDAPPGVYHVRVTVYVQEQGEIIHLPIIPEGGRMLADHVLLNRVRVVP